jgi:hypothetical protein
MARRLLEQCNRDRRRLGGRTAKQLHADGESAWREWPGRSSPGIPLRRRRFVAPELIAVDHGRVLFKAGYRRVHAAVV